MTSPSDREKEKIVRFVRNAAIITALIIMAIAGGILLYQTQEESRNANRISQIRLACPAGMKNSVQIQTPDKYQWSKAVTIPPHCDAEYFVNKGTKIDIMTFPDKKIFLNGVFDVNAYMSSHTEAVAFRSKIPTIITIIFHPYNTLK